MLVVELMEELGDRVMLGNGVTMLVFMGKWMVELWSSRDRGWERILGGMLVGLGVGGDWEVRVSYLLGLGLRGWL